MAENEYRVRFRAVKKSGDKLLDASKNWALAADDIWWAPLPENALGRAGKASGMISNYTDICRDVNAELRSGSRTLGMAAAALWKVSQAYENAEDKARDMVLRERGFDPKDVADDYW